MRAPVTIDSLRGKYGSVGGSEGGELGYYGEGEEEKVVGCWQDYMHYLESVEAVGWWMVTDQRKLRIYTRGDRFAVGLYKLMVNVAVGVCVRSLNTCQATDQDKTFGPSNGFVDSILYCAVLAWIFALYEMVAMVPLFRYILSRDPLEQGFFQRYGCSDGRCRVVIYFPILLMILTIAGFMTASQGAPPECKYTLFSGEFRWDGLLTGLWIFSLSAFFLGYLQSVFVRRCGVPTTTASSICLVVLQYWLVGAMM